MKSRCITCWSAFQRASAHANRMFEYTDDSVRAYVAPHGGRGPVAADGVADCGDAWRSARVNRSSLDWAKSWTLRGTGTSYRYRFVPNADVAPLPLDRMLANAHRWGIEDFEFYRTHWAVKNVDAYAALWGTVAGSSMPGPKAFRLPTQKVQSLDLVAVMMPFDAKFAAVYDTLRGAASRCRVAVPARRRHLEERAHLGRCP